MPNLDNLGFVVITGIDSRVVAQRDNFIGGPCSGELGSPMELAAADILGLEFDLHTLGLYISDIRPTFGITDDGRQCDLIEHIADGLPVVIQGKRNAVVD